MIYWVDCFWIYDADVMHRNINCIYGVFNLFTASDEKEVSSSDTEKKPEKSKELSPVEKVLQSELKVFFNDMFV